MVNRNSNNGVENVSPRTVVSQKNMDTLRIISNIILPSSSNQWNPNNGYVTDEYKNQDHKNVIEERDILDEALSAALNTENQSNVMEELTNISVPESLLQALSPWEVDLDGPSEAKWTSTSNSKSGTNKEKSKSRRQPVKEGHFKKQKNKEPSNQLKNLLLQCDSKKDKNKCTKIEQEVVILSDSNSEENIEIFSQDDDMCIFKKAIDLKRTLILDKEAAEREVITSENNIARLREELQVAQRDLEELRSRRDNLTKKVNWVIRSFN